VKAKVTTVKFYCIEALIAAKILNDQMALMFGQCTNIFM